MTSRVSNAGSRRARAFLKHSQSKHAKQLLVSRARAIELRRDPDATTLNLALGSQGHLLNVMLLAFPPGAPVADALDTASRGQTDLWPGWSLAQCLDFALTDYCPSS